jgi:hypothetical protein
MKYTLDTGRTINIPDADIARLQKSLKISEEEAIQTWLVDEEYISDETVDELTEKAKKNRITATVHKAKAEDSAKKERKPREKKENPLKKQIIDAIFAGLSQNLPENVTINITNDEKYIDFAIDGLEFTVNLVQHRPKK